MSNLRTVEQLRQDGCKVRVRHFRYYSPIYTIGDQPVGDYIDPRGGYTEIKVRTPNGEEKYGVAKCALSDNYNKKLGVKIALGRALSATVENIEERESILRDSFDGWFALDNNEERIILDGFNSKTKVREGECQT